MKSNLKQALAFIFLMSAAACGGVVEEYGGDNYEETDESALTDFQGQGKADSPVAAQTDNRSVPRDIVNAYNVIEIKHALDQGYMSGFPDGSFRPKSPVTRAQFAQIIYNVFLEENASSTLESAFRDTQGHWASNAIAHATNSGFISGYGNGIFKPDAPMQRQEVFTALSSGFGLKGGSEATLSPYQDDDRLATWARPHTQHMLANNFLASDQIIQSGSLSPRSYIQRGSLAGILYYVSLYEADLGAAQAKDRVSTSNQTQLKSSGVPVFACINGTLYASASAVASIGYAGMWGAAILEPSPVGEAVAYASSYGALAFIGGTFGLAVYNLNQCIRPLASLATSLAVNGYYGASRALRGMIFPARRASVVKVRCALIEANSQGGTGTSARCNGYITGQGSDRRSALTDASRQAPRGCRTKHCRVL